MNNLKHPRYQPGDIKIINELTNRRILFLVDPKLLQFTIYQNSTLKKKQAKITQRLCVRYLPTKFFLVWIRAVPTVIVPWPPRSKETDSRRPWVLTTMEATWWRFLKF
jgi:hypothetical protein